MGTRRVRDGQSGPVVTVVTPPVPGGSFVAAQAWNTTEDNTLEVGATENYVRPTGSDFAPSLLTSSAFAFDANSCLFVYSGDPILVSARALFVVKQFTFADVFITPAIDLNGDTLTVSSQTNSGEEGRQQTTLDFVELQVSTERLLRLEDGDEVSAVMGATTGAAPIGLQLELDRLLLTIVQYASG